MGRRFQSGHSVVFPVPAALNGTDAGPRTILAVGKCTSAYQCIVWTTPTGATPGWWLEIDTAGTLHLNYGTGNSSLRNVGTIVAGADAIWTARKGNGGSVNPFGRHFTGAGFATDGGDIDPGATLVDGLAIDTSYGIQVGVWGNLAGSPFFSTDFTAYFLAFWNTEVAGATLAGLTKTKAGIIAGSPDYWISFEGTTATDSVGGSPTIVGTTTTADPSGFFSSGATGAADLSASPTITATGTRVQSAAASLTASPTLTSTGTRVQPAAAVLSASPALTATGTRVQPAAAALTAVTTLTPAGVRTQPATLALSASPSLTAAATRIQPAAAGLAASPTMTAAAQGSVLAAVSLSAAPALTATAAAGPVIPYVTAELTPGALTAAVLSPAVLAPAVLTPSAAAAATLIAGSL